MNGLEWARSMAAYNRWMNERLYAVVAGLSDAERKRDRGAFFRSIHGTLNHLLLGDRIGIWHETYRVHPGDWECVYNNMPPFGLAKATRAVPATGRRESAPGRMAAASR
jgi:hypothetical protein